MRLRHVTRVRAARGVLIVALLALVEWLSRSGAVDPLVVPAPSAVAQAVARQVRTDQFGADVVRTLSTVGISFGTGGSAGMLLAVVGWRFGLVGRVIEPYLVSLYALPLLVFYPLLLTMMGLGPGPIIVIASLTALVPVALNTMIALRSISPVLVKLGETVNCSRWQLYKKILLPAAMPLAAPGLKLGFMYALIATIAMEFILATEGLGFRIGFYFKNFALVDMWAEIIFVSFCAVVVLSALNRIESRIRRDML